MLGAIVKKYWKLLLSTMLVSALGSASLIALSSAYTSLDVSLNDYMVDYRHPDAIITTAVRTRDIADELAEIPGVEDVDARLVGDSALISPEGRYLSIRAMSYDEDDFQKFHMWDEADAHDADPILLEYNFAVDNGISAGDTVSIKVDDEYRDYFVAGIVSAPETLSVRPSENAWGYNSDFGYVYAPTWLLEKEPNPEHDEAVRELERSQNELAEAEQAAAEEHDQALSELDDAQAALADARSRLTEESEAYKESLKAYTDRVSEVEAAWEDAQREFEDAEQELSEAAAELSEWEGYQVFCNQFLLRMSDGADREQTLEAALDVLGDDVKSSYLYQDSPAKKRIDTNLAPIGTMSTFVPMVFFAVTLVVVFLFMSLIVRQSRREIGILRALGFSQRRIRTLYCATNLVVSLGSILLGSLAGWGICLYTNVRYGAFFPLPEFTDVFDWGSFALAATLTIAVGQLATILSTGIIGRIQPSEAMTRPAPADTNVPRAVEAATSSVTPLTKFSVASTLRNPLRFVFATVCLAASVMIIFASLSFLASKDVILDQLFGQRINYDIQVFFDGDIDEDIIDELEALDYVDTVESMLYCASEVSFEGRTEKATINALTDDAQLIRVYDESGNEADIPESGIVLERHVAERIGAEMGDTVEVDGVPMEVVAMTDQYVSRFQYVSLAQAEALGDETMGSLVCSFDPAHEQDLVALISSKDGYVYSVLTSVFKEGLDSTFALTDLASWILIAFAVIIGLVIVINTAQTNLLEQKKELCVLRILGFQHRALSAHMFIQSLLSYVVACAIGLPCGILLAQVSLARLTTADLEYPFANGPLQHLITALLVLVYVVVSHLIAMRTLKRWDLVESVKDRE